MPIARHEVDVLLLEPQATINTGDVSGPHTAEAEWI
jgi:hypothetical protein